MRVLMVCLGNICRSPMAEGILREKAKLNHIDLEIDSAGTANYHVGEAPDKRAVATAKKYKVDISDLRGRQFSTEDFDLFDRIFVMDNSNLSNVLQMARNDSDRNKVSLFLDLIPDQEMKDVPDPWFGGPEGFIHVYELLNSAADHFISQLKKEEKH